MGIHRHILSLLLLLTASLYIFADGQSRRQGYYYHRLNDSTLPPRERAAYADSLLGLGCGARVPLLKTRSELYYTAQDWDRAAASIRELLDIDLDTMSQWQRLDILALAVKSMAHVGDYAEATRQAHLLLKESKPDSLIYYDVRTLLVLDEFTRMRHKGDDRFLKEAEVTLDKIRGSIDNSRMNSSMQSMIYINRMGRAIESDSLDTAMEYAMRVEPESLDAVEREGFIVYMAMLYERMGEMNIAKSYLENFLSEPGESYNKGVALLNYMGILNAEGQYRQALDMYQRHINLLPYFTRNNYYAHLLVNVAIAQAGLGDEGGTFGTMYQAWDIVDSLYTDSGRSVNARNFEVWELQDRVADLEHAVNPWRTSAVVTAVMLILAIGVIVYMLCRIRRQRRRIYAIEQSAAADNDRYISDGQEHEREYQRLARTASAQAMRLEQMQQTLAEVMRTIDVSGDTPGTKLKRISESLRALGYSHDTWEMFDIHFEQASPEFIVELRKRHPDLSPRDIRLACFISMNLSSKEIAEMSKRSVRSVDSARYRLSKKLNLAEGDTLSAYLGRLSASVSTR